MDIQTFINAYGDTLDDGQLNNGVKDGVIIPQDIAVGLQRGVFGQDTDAIEYAQQRVANPNSNESQMLLHYRDFLQAGLGGEQAPPPAPEASPQSDLGTELDRSGTYSGASYANPDLVGKKQSLIDEAARQGASPQETAWLITHALVEAHDMEGAANGDGKTGSAYNVSIFNLPVGMLKKYADVSESQAKSLDYSPGGSGYSAAVGTLLASLRSEGLWATEAVIRGGGTGLNELKAGFATDTYGVQEWVAAITQRTNAVLQDPGYLSGDKRFQEGIRHV